MTVCMSQLLAENTSAFVRCQGAVGALRAALCVCGSLYLGETLLWYCTPAEPWESCAVQQHKTMGAWMSWKAPLGASKFTGMRSPLWVEQSVWLLHCLSSWTPLSFLAFPQLPLLTGSSMLCPGNQLPLTTLGGNSVLSSSLVFSHIESQKVKRKFSGQPELDLFPFHVLIPLNCITNSEIFTQTNRLPPQSPKHYKPDSAHI